MNTTFFFEGHWFVDAGQGEPHRERNHKTVFVNEWDLNDGVIKRAVRTRKRRKKDGSDRLKRLPAMSKVE